MSAHTPFQSRVAVWAVECFGAEIAGDKLERMDRLIEETLEFAQSTGYPADRVRALSGYVYSRPAGEPGQEVGGMMTTLAAACHTYGLDMEAEARRELDRITTPEMVEKIRAKQAAKPSGSALPIAVLSEDALPTGSPADMLQAGDRFQHRWGTTYRVIGKGQLQTSEPLADYATVVVYQSEAVDGLIWVRPVSEFTDGRFAALPSAPERFDYLTDMQARVLWGTEDDEPLPDGRVRVCAGEWVRIPGGYYFDASAGLLHPETAPATQATDGARVALREITEACEADFGVPSEGDEDDEAVGAGEDGPMAVTFGMLRRARAALA